MNLTCAICSDLLMPSDDIHMTPCGHAFHYACLLQWLQRSKTCPQCRNKCHEKSLIKAYFNVAVSDDSTAEDSAMLLHKLDNLTLAVREKDKTQSDLSDRFSIMRNPRLAARTTALPPNKNLVFNGLGGSERKENFPGFPARKETLPAAVPVKPSTSTTVSLSKRVKTGKLTRHPSTTKFSTAQQMMDDFLLPDDDD